MINKVKRSIEELTLQIRIQQETMSHLSIKDKEEEKKLSELEHMFSLLIAKKSSLEETMVQKAARLGIAPKHGVFAGIIGEDTEKISMSDFSRDFSVITPLDIGRAFIVFHDDSYDIDFLSPAPGQFKEDKKKIEDILQPIYNQDAHFNDNIILKLKNGSSLEISGFGNVDIQKKIMNDEVTEENIHVHISLTYNGGLIGDFWDTSIEKKIENEVPSNKFSLDLHKNIYYDVKMIDTIHDSITKNNFTIISGISNVIKIESCLAPEKDEDKKYLDKTSPMGV